METAVKNKICLVTGGGGSIGSEIVRELVRRGAAKVIAVDISENGLHELITETDGITPEIASVRDRNKMERVFEKYRPETVFHAAAHKHVSFMELCPEEAVKNNIYGTKITAEAADKYGAERFILISTDKAVEPISVMGASKRVCEMLISDMSERSDTIFTVTRFGNVTGSSGSVIPLFEKQIKRGLVTVTDKDVTRYFMSIPQAARLAADAADTAEGGEIFIAEMGERVNILGLAEQMIRDAGKKPYDEVKIKFTGLGKGDKLHEKLFFDFEKPQRCKIKGAYTVKGSSIAGLESLISELLVMADRCDRDGIAHLLTRITAADYK